jgi:hypothetical protein
VWCNNVLWLKFDGAAPCIQMMLVYAYLSGSCRTHSDSLEVEDGW